MRTFHSTLFTLLALLALGTVGCQADLAQEQDDFVPDEPSTENADEDISDDDDSATEEDVTADDDDSATEEDLYEGDEPGECLDGADNDQDGLFDCDDPDCSGAPACVEEDEIVDSSEEADADFDTFDAPFFFFNFRSSGGLDTFTVSEDVSAPFGDPHDWIAFTTPAPQNNSVRMTLSLDCEGGDDLRAILWDDESGPSPLVGGGYSVSCGQQDNIYLDTNHDYLVRVFTPYTADVQVLTTWSLTVSW
jgi:hypothetical protein